MFKYNPKLKKFSQKLRTNQTDAERKLWQQLRKNQIAGIKFSRQKPIGNYILDFYAHQLKLAIELDGDQHFYDQGKNYDQERDTYLASLGIQVMRIPNNEIFDNIEGVVQNLWNIAQKPSQPHFKKGGVFLPPFQRGLGGFSKGTKNLPNPPLKKEGVFFSSLKKREPFFPLFKGGLRGF